MKVPASNAVAIDTVDLVKALTEDQRINLIREACNALEYQGSIEKVRVLVNDPTLDD